MKYKVKEIFIGLIITWSIVAGVRSIYNISKLFTEEKKWYFISDEQKKELAYGDLHYLFRFVEKNTKNNAVIHFVDAPGKEYYLSRYYLYPRKILWDTQKNLEIKKGQYILTLSRINDDLKLQKVGVFEFKDKKKAILYKL